MVRKQEQCRMKLILAEAISMLCKASLQYRNEMYIEGLIGITLDNHDIFLVNLNESIQKTANNNCKKTPGQASPFWRTEETVEKDCLTSPPDGSCEVGGKRRRTSSPHPTAMLTTVKQEIEENGSEECGSIVPNVGPTSGRSTPSSDMSEEARMVIDLSPPPEKQDSLPASPVPTSTEAPPPTAPLPLPVTTSLSQGAVSIDPFVDNGADDFGSHLSLSAETSLETALPGSWESLDTNQDTAPSTSGLLTSESMADQEKKSEPPNITAESLKKESSTASEQELGTSGDLQPHRSKQIPMEKTVVMPDSGDVSQTHIGGIALPQILSQIIERAKETQNVEMQNEGLDTDGDQQGVMTAMKEEMDQGNGVIRDEGNNTNEGSTTGDSPVVPGLQHMMLPTMHPALQTSQLMNPESLFYQTTPPNFVNPFSFSRGPGRPSSMQKQTLPFPQGQVMYPPGFVNPFPRGHFSPVKGPPFICGVCGKWYTARSNLSSHMLLHKDKVYPCESCGKVFNHPGYLKQHVKYVHDQDKNYECPVCHKRFAKNQNLQIHMRRHLGSLDEASVERMLQMAASAAHAQASGGSVSSNQGNQASQSNIMNQSGMANLSGQVEIQESHQKAATTTAAMAHSNAASAVTLQPTMSCGPSQAQPGFNVYEAGLMIKSEPQM